MGTRSLVHIQDEGKTLVTLYRQYDGYPTGIGADIIKALANGKAKLTGGGYSGGDAAPQMFNGMGCLAAYLVGALKTPHDMGKGNAIGNVYVYPADTSDCGEEFTYTLDGSRGDSIKLTVKASYSGDILYSGPLSKFDPKKAEESDSDDDENDS